MKDLKIVGWTDFESNFPTKTINNEELYEIIKLIREEIFINKYVFSGEEHQNSLTGVPVFSDGTCFRASMRCWGMIMALIYAGPNDEKLTYMDFYMSLGNRSKMPEYKEINVKPLEVEVESIGCTVQIDHQIIEESLSFGMEFMTTDKVLKKLYKLMKNN